MNKTAISIAEFCRDYGVGKTTAYKLARQGRISIARVGRRSLVIVKSADDLIANSTGPVADVEPQDVARIQNDAAPAQATPQHNS